LEFRKKKEKVARLNGTGESCRVRDRGKTCEDPRIFQIAHLLAKGDLEKRLQEVRESLKARLKNEKAACALDK